MPIHFSSFLIKAYGHSCLCSNPPSCCVSDHFVMREHFKLAHAPLLFIKTYKYSCFRSRPVPYMFGRILTRERFGCAHASLLLIKAYEHFVRVFMSSLYVRSYCDEGPFRACPCTSPPHKGVRAFVNVCSSFPCAFILCARLYLCTHTFTRVVNLKAR